MSTPAIPQQQEQTPGTLRRVRQYVIDEGPRWIRYLYFLRFSILLWLFPLVLLWANDPTRGRSLVSGIVTPAALLQYLCVTFFLVAGSFVALMLARVVVINGMERFGEKGPEVLCWLLAHDSANYEWVAPLLCQLNTAVAIAYFISNGLSEGVKGSDIAAGVTSGLVLAFLFWYALTAIYYITYRPTGAGGAMKLGKQTARTLLLPRRMLWLMRSGENRCFGDALEDADAPLPLGWVARVFPIPGYRWTPAGALYEGHYFSLLAACGFFALYFVLWPLTAPVPVPFASNVALAIELLGGVIVYGLVLAARVKGAESPEKLRSAQRNLTIWKVLLALPILGFTLAIPAVYHLGDAARFPILALVLILVISLTWLFGAIAFYADRYRLPVLTVFLLLLVIPRILHWTGAQEEHYISVAGVASPITLPTPGAILDRRIQLERQASRSGDATPTFIIVTSTGGGIHAAGWTAAILQRLEDKFGSSFHNHVLLMSTVSGGSAGLYTFLRELHGAQNGDQPRWGRMVDEAKCSSLEAVGWGLVYYDIPKAIVPLLPYLDSPSEGLNDLTESPLGKDRTWGLRRAFARNLNDTYCKSPEDPTLMIPLEQVKSDQSQNPDNALTLTLGAFNAMEGEHPYPAFSMNTTTVEDGARFLLANYRVEKHEAPLAPSPAESFLDVYGRERLGGGYPDLPLATAAQLSATFPYVSSAATFPADAHKQTVHFVDGGYYDNDGTATAIEFLRAALDDSHELNATAAAKVPAKAPAASTRLRILLVEIRNSLDPSSPDYPDEQSISALKNDPDDACKAWNLMDQATAPLKAFYGAGHGSVTERNRNGLRLLEGAYKDKLILQHFVIDDRANGVDTVSCKPDKNPPTDPLNWSLTPRQQREIAASADKYADKYQQIFSCFSKGQACPSSNREARKP